MSNQALAIATSTASTSNYSYSLGFYFTANNNLSVTSLGAYLDPASAWTVNKVVTIYRVSDQSVLGTVTITPGDGSATQTGQILYKPVTPFTILSGTACAFAVVGYASDKLDVSTGSGMGVGTPDATGAMTFSGQGAIATSGTGYPSSDGAGGNTHPYGSGSFLFTSSGGTLTAAQLTLIAADSTGMTLQANTSGGTAPLSYQWQSASTPDGTMTNVSGATAQTHKFAVGVGALPLYVQCNVTDSSGSPVTVASYGYPSGAVYTGSPVLPFAVVACADPKNYVLLSDSTGVPIASSGHFDEPTFEAILGNAALPGLSTFHNYSQPGTTAQGWANSLAAGVIGELSAGVYTFAISLGVNDSKSNTANSGESTHLSAAAWSTAMASICSQLLGASKFAGSRVILLGTGYVAAPTQYSQWDDTSISLLNQYNAAIPALCNGTTILQGSQYQRYNTWAANQLLFVDGVHETTTGATVIAEQYAADILRAEATAGATGGTGGISMANNIYHWNTTTSDGTIAGSTIAAGAVAVGQLCSNDNVYKTAVKVAFSVPSTPQAGLPLPSPVPFSQLTFSPLADIDGTNYVNPTLVQPEGSPGARQPLGPPGSSATPGVTYYATFAVLGSDFPAFRACLANASGQAITATVTYQTAVTNTA